MEILIIFGIVCVPLAIVGFVALYKERQEERKEKVLGNT